jgi:hypothetical protein
VDDFVILELSAFSPLIAQQGRWICIRLVPSCDLALGDESSINPSDTLRRACRAVPICVSQTLCDENVSRCTTRLSQLNVGIVFGANDESVRNWKEFLPLHLHIFMAPGSS